MIIFKTLTFQNILSVGNTPVTIDLNSHKTTLIHGTNGTGKSTVLDALTYSLFGKPFRKVNLPQLLNSQNKKGLLCSIEFTIGKNDFRVVRGMKPKVFEIWKNEEIIENKAADKEHQAFLENSILRMTSRSFSQIVILGSTNFVPFMQLPSMGRRECVEDFLDIGVFSTMSIIAKERSRGLKERCKEVANDINNLEYKTHLLNQRIRELEQHSTKGITELESKISESIALVAIQTDNNQRFINHETELKEEETRLLENDPSKKAKNYNGYVIKLGNKIEQLNKNIKFYTENDTCHSCSQEIKQSVKDKYIEEAMAQVSELNSGVAQAKQLLQEQEDILDKVKAVQDRIGGIQRQIFERTTKINMHKDILRECSEKKNEIENETGSVDKEIGKLQVLTNDLNNLKLKQSDLTEQIKNHDIVVSLLKDSGIKTQIVKKYIPVMNKYIRKYLGELDMPIHFTLDGEFNESVSSPLHQDFSYGSFSEGQKGRIDLALLFTWREVCRLKNSVSTNILFLDEVFSGSLDEVGKELLLHMLRYNIADTNVVVVDHTLSGTFRDKFDRQLEVTRVSGFSKYA